MKKQVYISIKFILILVVILTAIDWFIGFGLKKNNKGYYGKINKIIQKKSLPEVAFFSSSVGEMGFDCKVLEKELNKSVYNFSFAGTTFIQYKGLFDEINQPNNNTKVVVLGETIFSLNKMDALTEIERFLPYIQNENVYNSLYEIQPDLAFKSRYVPFYKYIAVSGTYYKQSLMGWKNFITKKSNRDSLMGQTVVTRKWEADQDSIWKYAKPIPIIIDTSVLNTFNILVDKLVANGKKVVVVFPPLYMPKGQKIIDVTEIRKTLSSIADNKNIFYFDFSEFMVDKKYFYNVLHLNATGASEFSSAFADSVNKYVFN